MAGSVVTGGDGVKRILALSLAFAAPATAQEFPVARCINLGAALEAPVEGDWGHVIKRDHLRAIAEAGFDTIRLPVRFHAHWDGAAIDPVFLDRVDQVIGWARADGLIVILDLHHFEPLMAAPAAHADTFVAIWAFLARHYAGAPDDLLFELLNEATGALDTRKAQGLYARVFAAIRPLHPDRWVITGGGGWNDLDGMLEMAPPGPFEARTFHWYDPWDFTHQQAPWIENAPPPRGWSKAEGATIRAGIARAAGLPYPVLLGEFGAYDAAPVADALEWTRTVRMAAEAAGLPWCHWGFSQGAPGFRAWDLEAPGWRTGFPEVLIP